MQRSARWQMLLSMVIFGTIGLFVKYIPLPSAAIALVRGAVGLVFLLLVMAVSRKKISPSAIKANLLILILSGIALGGNWLLLFEAYRHTTVAAATLCYYLAPVFLVLLSPVFYKEKLTGRKLICTLVALIGMVLVSGVLDAGFHLSQLTGVLYGLSAAVLYAAVVLLNKALKGISAPERTVVQLLVSSVVLLPYVLLTTQSGAFRLELLPLLLLLVVGIVHTGVAYALYFNAVGALPAQTAALLSYLDPVLAVLLSALLLREPMSWSVALGAVLILGSTLISELKPNSK
jgi:RarD protein